MGHKKICLDCRKSYSQGTNFLNQVETNCPECGNPMVLVDQKFQPPKSTDIQKWEVVKYLIQNGFYYQRITDLKETGYATYPENLRDAKEFVDTYKFRLKD